MLDKLGRDISDNLELFEMSHAEGDSEGLAAIEAETQTIASQVKNLEFRRMFNQAADPNNAFIEIQAGAGGTEACDWASILMRQYLRYAERKGFKATIEDETSGDVAGIRGASIKIEGDYAFGLLRTETGVHRLVRKSPFDSSGGRHTSFASVFVYPEIDDSIEIDINPADVRVDTYRASGAGGQHINKTSSAIRVTHIPTGMVVECQNERSQFQNKDKALEILRSRLLAQKQKEQQDAINANRAGQVGTGDRSEKIRTYNFPQDRCTDHRIGLTVHNLDKIMDGNLDEIIDALATHEQAEKLRQLNAQAE